MLPESRLVVRETISDVLSIVTVVSQEFSVVFSVDWSGVAIVQENGVDQEHTCKVESA